jgi:hypothetical protein
MHGAAGSKTIPGIWTPSQSARDVSLALNMPRRLRQ